MKLDKKNNINHMQYRNLFLLLILIFSLFLRTYKLDEYSIWHDEKASVSCAVGIPYAGINLKYSSYHDLGFRNMEVYTSDKFWKLNTLSNVVKSTIQDNGSIAYFLTLHFWVSLFGVSDFSIRSLSVLFGLLTVYVMYWFTLIVSQSTRIAFI